MKILDNLFLLLGWLILLILLFFRFSELDYWWVIGGHIFVRFMPPFFYLLPVILIILGTYRLIAPKKKVKRNFNI